MQNKFATGLLLVSAILLGAGSGETLAQSEEPIAGHYKTNYGPLKLFPDKNGLWVGVYSYKGLPAHIFFKRGKSGFFEAIWVQGISEVRCGKKHSGSPYWGRARLTFKGNRVLSLWNYCDRELINKKQFHWTGDYAE